MTRKRVGHMNRGAGHPHAKLNDSHVQQIRTGAARGQNHTYLARAYGVSRKTIYMIVNRFTWKHVA